MKRWILGGLAAMGFVGSLAVADTAGEWSPQTFTLGNGMDVVVLPDHRAPVVTHMVWYKVGAADEEPGKSGIAHFFEHLMFKATDDIADGELDAMIQRRGGQLNAFTSWDYTAYFERVAKPHLEKMMEIEADRMMDLIVDENPEGSFYSERDVVVEERLQVLESSPSRVLSEKVLGAYWAGHPYEITILGHMEEIKQLSPEDAVTFYRQHYSPENAILIVAGDVTEDEVRTLAEKHYGQIEPTGLVSGERKWRAVDPIAETQLITHTDPKVRQPVWYRYYNGTSLRRDRDFALALDVGLDVLGGGNTSLLFQSLVEDKGLAVDVGTFGWINLHDEGPAAVYATPAPGVTIDDLEVEVMAEVDRLLEEGFDEADVTRVRNSKAANA
ncbi:MAG: pitrilysin family protein, partial [Pseudomonadota bacterium]